MIVLVEYERWLERVSLEFARGRLIWNTYSGMSSCESAYQRWAAKIACTGCNNSYHRNDMTNTKRKMIVWLRLWRPLIHVFLIIGSFWCMALLRPYTDFIPFVQLRIPAINLTELLIFAAIAAVVFVIIGMGFWLYQLWRPIHGYYKKFLKTWRIWVLVASFIAFMWFWFLFTDWISRFVLIYGSISSFIVITIADSLYNKLNYKLEHTNPYEVLLISDDPVLSTDITDSIWSQAIYTLTAINPQDYTSEHLSAVDIVITAWWYDTDLLQQVADDVRIAWKLFYHASDSFFLEDLITRPQRIGHVMAMEYRPSPLDWWRRVVKRIFDSVVSFFAIILLAPLMVCIVVLIKIDSKGPALYKQKRVWKNNQEFTFIKFRSMYTHLSVGDEYWWKKAWQYKKELMNSDKNIRKGELQKIQDDPRVTRVWKFLRKTSLDELPNLFSVLQGTMSLVWPRPHEPFEVARYKSWQKRLLSIKPWITGYAQIFWRDALSFDEEAKLDLYYIQNRSVQMDIYILITTLKVVFSGK